MLLNLIIGAIVVSLLFAFYNYMKVIKKSPDNKKMEEISELIHKGAMTFLNKEYMILVVFVVVVTGALYYFIGQNIAIAFVIGAIFSALAGNIGMRIATKARAMFWNSVKLFGQNAR